MGGHFFGSSMGVGVGVGGIVFSYGWLWVWVAMGVVGPLFVATMGAYGCGWSFFRLWVPPMVLPF